MKRLASFLILRYLRFWAKLQLKKVKPIIIGITGSAGKTSTRIAVASIVRSLGRVKEAQHANSESGIPLNILGLSMSSYSLWDWGRVVLLAPFAYLFNRQQYDYYVVEMGIDSPFPPKNMSYLLTILRPHIGVVLNANLVHTQTFDPLVKDRNTRRRRQKLIQLIATEKGKLVTSMPADDNHLAIINLDQSEIAGLAKNISARLLTFGKSKKADLRIIKLTQSRTSFKLTLAYQQKQATLQFDHLLLEPNYAYTFAAAISVGLGLGLSLKQAITALQKHYTPPPGRWRIFAGLRHSHLIDSSYNASPLTMKAALQKLAQLGGRSFKLAVIGDMRELGQEGKQAHKDLADWLIQNSDQALLFGQLTRKYTFPILKKNHFPAQHFQSMADLISYLQTHIKPQSWILFKGSQNTILLERAVEAVLLNKAEAKYLCRRGPYWDKIRSQTP